MRQNQCLINVSHLHCKCTVNSSMLLAFFVSMEILWLCLSSHLLSVGLRVLLSASEDRSRWTPRASSGRPQPVGLIHAIDTLNTQTVEFPHHSHQSTNILIIRAIDFVFLIATPITSPVSRIFHSTGENYFFSRFLSSSFRHLYNYFGATFRRIFSSKSTSDFEVSNLVAPRD